MIGNEGIEAGLEKCRKAFKGLTWTLAGGKTSFQGKDEADICQTLTVWFNEHSGRWSWSYDEFTCSCGLGSTELDECLADARKHFDPMAKTLA